MDGKMLARLGAIVFVSLAVTATAIEMIAHGLNASHAGMPLSAANRPPSQNQPMG